MTVEDRILSLVDEYVTAWWRGDISTLCQLYWVEDPRFTEVYVARPPAHRPHDSNDALPPEPSARVRAALRRVRVHFLSLEVAYCLVPCAALDMSEHGAYHITLLFLKKGNDWKIIHSHFSRQSDRVSV